MGYALHVNPEPGTIPCHRIVFADGRLAEGFAFGGPEAQRTLLEDEGVAFLANGHVDLQALAGQRAGMQGGADSAPSRFGSLAGNPIKRSPRECVPRAVECASDLGTLFEPRAQVLERAARLHTP